MKVRNLEGLRNRGKKYRVIISSKRVSDGIEVIKENIFAESGNSAFITARDSVYRELGYKGKLIADSIKQICC